MLAAPQPAEGVEGPTKTTPSEPSQVVPAEAAPAPQPKSQPPNKAAAASAGSSDKQGNKEPVPNLDLMGQLVSKGTCEVDMEGPKGKSKTKDQFLEASLIIPAIALKKFQQSALEQTSRLGSFLAILGVDEVKMYKTTRPKLAAMCAGDVLSDPSFFWQHASSQLKARKAKAIFLFTQFAGDLDSVSQLSGCTHNTHTAICILRIARYTVSVLLGMRDAQSWKCVVLSPCRTQLTQVLEAMPLSLVPPDGSMCLIFLPGTDPLGKSDTDYSNLDVREIKLTDHKLQPSTLEIMFASTGKLGGLSGGFLHIPDAQKVMSSEEAKTQNIEIVRRSVALKRTANITLLM